MLAARHTLTKGIFVAEILKQIIEHKQAEVALLKSQRPEGRLLAQLRDAPPPRDFVAALANASGMAVIAEIKKASPSAGLLRRDFDPAAIAREYARHGASCLSVLTDECFFQGSLADLQKVRQAVDLPLLRKDFLIDRYQVFEARAAGADCILLIAECLDDGRLRELYFLADELGMTALVELHDPANLDRVLRLQPLLLGVNNRDLRTFATDLGHTLSMAARIPPGCLLVSESGIQNAADVALLAEAGVRAVLVGETLMRAQTVGAKLQELRGAGARESAG
jgi:indole-3-glycerol phosphate synthase